MRLSMLLAAAVLGTALSTAAVAKAPAEGGEILWDTFGVPHIYARSEAGAFYGFGWAQAQSHGNILLKMYGESQARAAEYWGADYEAQDRWLVANDVPERSRAWFEAQTPAMRADLDAFAEGVNDYVAAHPDAIDPEMKKVLPLSGVDIIQHAHRLMNYTYIASERRVMASAEPVNEAGGSNAWAVAPSRSKSGHTMVLANPHLPWEPSPLTYYEAQLNAPGLSVYGATQVGLPVLRFGFNNNLSFTNTVNTMLGFTAYKLTLADGGYRFDGAVRPFRTIVKSYKVRQPDGSLRTITFDQRLAVQGPVFDLPDGRGTIALKVAGLGRSGVLQQYLDMDKAQNWAQFEAALKTVQAPMFNIVYGDRAGHILYLDNGILPRHEEGDYAFWSRAVPGDTSATLWDDVLSYDELPKVFDPPSGYVQNANDEPWGSTSPAVLKPENFPPYVSSPKWMSLRAQMSSRLLLADSKLGFDDFVQKKVTTKALMAERMLPDLLAAAAASRDADVRAAVALLKGWDGRFEPDARAALLFETWAGLFSPDNLTGQENYAVKWSIDDPLNTPRGLANPAKAVSLLKEAVAKTRQLYGRLDRPYGEVSRLKINDTSFPGNGGLGNLGIFRTISWGPLANGTRAPLAGETWVSLVEFGTPLTALGVMSYGNSSQPGSPHRTDQLHFVAEKKFRTLWLERKDVEANLEERVNF